MRHCRRARYLELHIYPGAFGRRFFSCLGIYLYLFYSLHCIQGILGLGGPQKYLSFYVMLFLCLRSVGFEGGE
jgi:hypothetical protein